MTLTEDTTSMRPIEMMVEIVAAYVAKNAVPAGDLPSLINSIHAEFVRLSAPTREPEAPPAKTPAVNIKKSVTEEYIICLEDGRRFKSLKRHLQTAYGMTPQEYKTKWNLPANYPMVAPAYAAKRSELAKSTGLGRKFEAATGTADEDAAPAPPVPPAETPAEPATAAIEGTPQPDKTKGRGRKKA